MKAAAQVSVQTYTPAKSNIEEEQVLERDFDSKAPDVFTVQNCDIDLTVDSEDETNSEEKVDKIVTSPREKLSFSDLKTISDSQMLTGNVINLLQKMLKQVFVDAMGLQDPVRGQNLSYDVYQNRPFVQIIHNGRYHWLALSKEGEIHVLDSKFNYVLSLQRKRQICALLCCRHKSIKVKIVPVQRQTVGVDCGLLAVAFIQYILSEEKNSTNVSFIQSIMKNHTFRAVKTVQKNRKKKSMNCPYTAATARFGWSLTKTYLKSKCSNILS